MDLLVTLGRTLGFSLTAGVSLYASVAILGLAYRYSWVALPEQFAIFDNDLVIISALTLYLIEFFADKVPLLDTVWDTLHTLIRPLGAALVAVATLGEASPGLQAVIALAGGTIAAGGHLTKAGTRVIVNASPEPFSNLGLSLIGDGFVFGLGFLALRYPIAALAVTVAALVIIALFLAALVRAARRRLWKRAPAPTAP